MADNEEAVAREVHDLLLAAEPDTAERDLASAFELAFIDKGAMACRSDDFRVAAFSAVQEIRNALAAKETSFSERKRLLLHAANSARSWLNARRFSDFY
jgi:hypothetical protein